MSHDIDLAVWAAHLRVDLRITEEIADLNLLRWANVIISETRGYWHGMTGRLADRLEVTEQAWGDMVTLHRPDPAAELGDSSVDLVSYILARVGLMEDGRRWHQARRISCAGYFERGLEVGCHGSEW